MAKAKAKAKAKTKTKTKAKAHQPSVPVTPALKNRALRLFDGLNKAYPDAHCELDFTNALEALVASILAAQCTDARVNMVTPALFKKYRKPQDYLDTPAEVLQEEIRSTGFFNNKTKAIKAACQKVVEEFGGRMPRTMDDLIALPGVGRKTANVILSNVYETAGIVVDTHMLRNAARMGLSTQRDAVKLEFDLQAIFPDRNWSRLSHLMPWHGRRCCTARKPNCDECPVAKDCPKLID
jgi:endonuclease-3